MRVQLDDLAALGGPVERGVDAREAVAGDVIEVRGAMNLAPVAVVEDAVNGFEIVAASGGKKPERDRP